MNSSHVLIHAWAHSFVHCRLGECPHWPREADRAAPGREEGMVSSTQNRHPRRWRKRTIVSAFLLCSVEGVVFHDGSTFISGMFHDGRVRGSRSGELREGLTGDQMECPVWVLHPLRPRHSWGA